MHAGLYKADRLNYVDPLGVPFDDAYVLTAKGTPERPIVIRAAGDGEPIFDGNGSFRLFDVMAAEHHIFQGLTIRNTDIAFHAGLKDVLGAKGLTVRDCRIEDVGIAVTTEYAGSKDFYIADNVIIGRDDRYRLNGWASPGIYGATPLKSYYAVKVYGSGHVICHNAVAYFHDGIDVSTYGTPEPDEDRKAEAIDIYNNDIHLMADDVVETGPRGRPRGRPRGARPGRRPGGPARLQDAPGAERGHRARSARRRTGLRHLREPARTGPGRPARRLSGRRSGFPAPSRRPFCR